MRWALRIFDDARFFLLQVHFRLRSGLRSVTVRAWGPLESEPGWKIFATEFTPSCVGLCK